MSEHLTPLQRIKALFASNETLTVQLNEQRQLVTTRDGELATMRQQLVDMTASRDTLQTRVTQLETEHAEAERMMGEALEMHENTDRIASTRAAAIAAGQGIPDRELPRLVAGAGGATRSKELLEQYNKLLADGKSTEAGEFFQRHEKEILT